MVTSHAGKCGDLVPGRISRVEPWFGGVGEGVVYIESTFGAVRVCYEFEKALVEDVS